jgi:hypothetical protein
MTAAFERASLEVRCALSDLPGLDSAAFDQNAGAAGSLARIRGVEADGRWQQRYLGSIRGGSLVGLLPVYWPTGGSWPDPGYSPAVWPLPDMAAEDFAANRCLLVGGVYDHRSALHVTDDPSVARECLREAARLAVESDRRLVFPFFSDRSRRILDHATDGCIQWCIVQREAIFPDVLGPDREARVGARVRGVLRRDRRLIDQTGTVGSVIAWESADHRTYDAIAEHNLRKGRFDHPELVHLRYAQWLACADVEVIVFEVRAGPLSGLLTALVWQNELELYEIGLPESDHSARLAVYLDLVFHRPFEYARRHQLKNIRAGIAGVTPKASRGAIFAPLYGGVLDADGTRRIARESL